jgi:hypothetical protein
MAEDDKCAYAPGLVQPEAMPVMACPPIEWTPEARQMLERIPSFIRGRIKSGVEQKAAAAGEISISVEFMQAHRPQGLPFGRPVRQAQ